MTQTRLGPPFGGTFATEPPPGAWTAARTYGSTGQIVVQLGGQPPKPFTDPVDFFAGFDFPIAPDATGDYIIAASVDVGPVSMLPRGFTAETQIAIGLDRGDGAPPITFTPPPQGVIGARYGIFTLAFKTHLTAGSRPFLTLAAGAMINYTGTPPQPPYAEIICTYKSAVLTLVTPTAKAADPLARLRAGKRTKREMTEEQWAKEEVVVFK